MISFALLWITSAALGLVAWGLLIELQTLRKRFPRYAASDVIELPVGSSVPQVSWIDTWTGVRIDNRTLSGQPSILAFLSSSCPLCEQIPHSLRELAYEYELPQTILICSGGQADCQFRCQPLHPRAILVLDPEMSIAHQFGVSNYPTTVFLDRNAAVYATSRFTRARDLANIVTALSTHRATEAV